MKNLIIVTVLVYSQFFRQLDYNTIETTSTLNIILEYLLTNKLFNMKKDFNPSRFPGHLSLPRTDLQVEILLRSEVVKWNGGFKSATCDPNGLDILKKAVLL
jgi:hypothetical protein